MSQQKGKSVLAYASTHKPIQDSAKQHPNADLTTRRTPCVSSSRALAPTKTAHHGTPAATSTRQFSERWLSSTTDT